MADTAITNRRPISPLALPPPAGSTLASFVLFASLIILIAMLYAAGEWWYASAIGFPSDAAWARAVVARNLTARHGLSFNPGAPAAGLQGPVWIGLLALAGVVDGKFVVAAKLLGVLCAILTAYLTWFIVLDLLGDWRFAFIAALLVAVSAQIATAALGGTEAALAALLVAAAVRWQALGWHGRLRTRAAGAVAIGLAALSRPELLLLLPLALVDRALVAATHATPGRRLRRALSHSLPELAVASLVLVPYVILNWQAGGPLWQQPARALHTQPPLAWPRAVLGLLWSSNPVVLCTAAIGLPVALLAAARPGTRQPSYLIVLSPLTLLLAPGFIWKYAAASNADFAAAYLTPLAAALAASGLFLAYRWARQRLLERPTPRARWTFAGAIAVICAGVFAPEAVGHGPAWQEHGFRVQKVSDLQGRIGRWAAEHLPPDASIASREVGAIAFFSRRRVVDLGGAISREGMEALSQPGSPDANLLRYIEKARPSHLAIRPSDFPDLSQRADLLTPAITCVVVDPLARGATTMVLYDTPWPPPSVREARGRAAL